MVLSLDQINRGMSSVWARPPRKIIIFSNARIRQGNGPYAGRQVLGFHKMGEDAVVLTHDSPARTLFHETTHNMGFYGETITRTLAAWYNFRSRWRVIPPIVRPRVRYKQVPVSKEQMYKYASAYGIASDPSDAGVIELVLVD